MLDKSQRLAVDKISNLSHRLFCVTGAGWSGKTYTLQHLQQLWADETNNITKEITYLAAPTGKAARVINDAFESSGLEGDNSANTFHRLLDLSNVVSGDRNTLLKLKLAGEEV